MKTSISRLLILTAAFAVLFAIRTLEIQVFWMSILVAQTSYLLFRGALFANRSEAGCFRIRDFICALAFAGCVGFFGTVVLEFAFHALELGCQPSNLGWEVLRSKVFPIAVAGANMAFSITYMRIAWSGIASISRASEPISNCVGSDEMPSIRNGRNNWHRQ